uniref:Uncharacterized protein n=1 Tax=Knipowitschia caucasica TaxID=637954 RepID=A0AAV2KL31_KNICA
MHCARIATRRRERKNNNPAHPDYTPSIFPQAVLKELTKSTTLDRFKRAQKRKAPSTTLVSRKERKIPFGFAFGLFYPSNMAAVGCYAGHMIRDVTPTSRMLLRPRT